MKYWIPCLVSCLFYFNTIAQNVGVNTPVPVENLQVDSAIKVGKNTALVGAKKNIIKFGDDDFVTIGEEIGDDKMYLRYGTLSLMRSANSIGNGYMGINTDAPTTTLDINGGLRIRGNGAAAGKTLTSDANGVAAWSGPVAFAATRSAATLVVSGFATNTTVFTALDYETNTGSVTFGPNRFTAPVTGIYHISGSVMIASNAAENAWGMLFNGGGGNKEFVLTSGATSGISLSFAFDYKMNAGQFITPIFVNRTPNPANIVQGAENTFFTGHLIK